MIRTFRYPLEPTKAQENILLGWLRSCQLLYNAALEERRNSWSKLQEGISYNDQTKSLTIIRKDDEAYNKIPSVVLRSGLKRIDRAFQAFFRRVKRGDKPGYPRFRSRDRYQSFSLMGSIPRVERGLGKISRVRLPKLGFIRFKEYRPIKGSILDVSVKLEPSGKWFVSFSCDLGKAPDPIAFSEVVNPVGIDLGLNSFAVLSTGGAIENPRFYRKSEAVLARRQRAVARKRRASSGRRRAKRLVAKAHLKIKNQRRDFAWKQAGRLVRKFDMIAHEDLLIRNMIRSNLGKSISDAGWNIFIQALACKAEEAGKLVLGVDPRGTSQRCSGCGVKVPKALSQRIHECPGCDLSLDRDHNAAINILLLGRSKDLSFASPKPI